MSNDKKHLGQNFLISNQIINFIIEEANIQSDDVVLEIGSGRGILLPLLCKKAKKVISVELDTRLYGFIKSNFSDLNNLIVKNEDGFRHDDYEFTVFISNLPYYKSKSAIEWLSRQHFSHGVVMVQKEFANKILYKYTPISILANYSFDLHSVMQVKRTNFFPVPNVDSTLIKFTKRKTLSKDTIKLINKIFLHKKTVRYIAKKYNIEFNTNTKNEFNRLQNNEIIEIVQEISKFL